MRLLFAIAHYFHPGPPGEGEKALRPGKYGSLRKDPRPRLRALAACIASLHQTFGSRQCHLDIATRTAHPATWREAHEVEVLVLTTRGRHLLADLPLPRDLWQQAATDAEPPLLGFECQAALAERLGIYDYYGFLEDDLMVSDPLFFSKLAWFNRYAGDHCLLQPNRFERAVAGPFLKGYIDGDLAPRVTAPFQDVSVRPEIRGQFLDRDLSFRRTLNPHAGCYFLSAGQMAHFAAHPAFLQRDDTRFIGPLESAASLGIMQAFSVYKPSLDLPGFLEVEHMGAAYMSLIGKGVAVAGANPAQAT